MHLERKSNESQLNNIFYYTEKKHYAFTTVCEGNIEGEKNVLTYFSQNFTTCINLSISKIWEFEGLVNES